MSSVFDVSKLNESYLDPYNITKMIIDSKKDQHVKPLELDLVELSSRAEKFSEIESFVSNMNSSIWNLSHNTSSFKTESNNSSIAEVYDGGNNSVNINLNITQVADRFVANSNKILDSDLQTGSISINGEEISINGLSSEEISDKINDLEGITSYIIRNDDDNTQIQVISDDTGYNNDVNIDYSSSSLSFNTYTQAQDTEYTINGVESTDSDTDVDVLGVGVNVKSVGNVNISSITDTKAIIEGLESFVSDYNSLVDIFKDNFSKDGMFSGDSTLRQLQTTMQGMNSGENSLSDLGISVDREGYIDINENKLQLSLKEDSDKLKGVFGNETFDRFDKYDDIGGLMDIRGDEIDQKITRTNEKIEDLEEKLKIEFGVTLDQFLVANESLTTLQYLQSTILKQ